MPARTYYASRIILRDVLYYATRTFIAPRRRYWNYNSSDGGSLAAAALRETINDRRILARESVRGARAVISMPLVSCLFVIRRSYRELTLKLHES